MQKITNCKTDSNRLTRSVKSFLFFGLLAHIVVSPWTHSEKLHSGFFNANATGASSELLVVQVVTNLFGLAVLLRLYYCCRLPHACVIPGAML